jgi:hypothetical protein
MGIKMVLTILSLISIMLGRFRMTVFDCLAEYEKLGAEVFGKPRLIRQSDHFVGPHKFNEKKLQKVFEDVTFHYSEDRESSTDGPITFATEPGLCKV